MTNTKYSAVVTSGEQGMQLNRRASILHFYWVVLNHPPGIQSLVYALLMIYYNAEVYFLVLCF